MCWKWVWVVSCVQNFSFFGSFFFFWLIIFLFFFYLFLFLFYNWIERVNVFIYCQQDKIEIKFKFYIMWQLSIIRFLWIQWQDFSYLVSKTKLKAVKVQPLKYKSVSRIQPSTPLALIHSILLSALLFISKIVYIHNNPRWTSLHPKTSTITKFLQSKSCLFSSHVKLQIIKAKKSIIQINNSFFSFCIQWINNLYFVDNQLFYRYDIFFTTTYWTFFSN